MFFGNDKHIGRSQAAARPARETTNIDNSVLATLEKEYSLMEQEHARIRAKALENYVSEPSNRADAGD